MKRCLSILITLLLALSLCACNQQAAQPSQDSDTVTTVPSGEALSQDGVTVPGGPSDPTTPTTPAEHETPVPAGPLPGEAVGPENPEVPEVEVTGGTPQFFLDDGGELVTLATLVTFLPQCDSLPQINTYYETIRADLVSTCDLNIEDAGRQRAELEAGGMEFTPWSIRVGSQITRNDGATLSVLRTVTEEWVEHEVVRYHAETFDVASQGRLVLGDLFAVGEEQYLPSLSEEAGTVDSLNFALTDDSLVLCTQQGTVSVPLSGLKDILKPQWAVE